MRRSLVLTLLLLSCTSLPILFPNLLFTLLHLNDDDHNQPPTSLLSSPPPPPQPPTANDGVRTPPSRRRAAVDVASPSSSPRFSEEPQVPRRPSCSYYLGRG